MFHRIFVRHGVVVLSQDASPQGFVHRHLRRDLTGRGQVLFAVHRLFIVQLVVGIENFQDEHIGVFGVDKSFDVIVSSVQDVVAVDFGEDLS